MTYPEFEIQMKRVFSEFDQKFYGPEKMKLIWNAVQVLPSRQFEKVVSELIANFRQAPLPKDFRDAAFPEIHKRTPDAEKTKQLLADQTTWADIQSELSPEIRAQLDKLKTTLHKKII